MKESAGGPSQPSMAWYGRPGWTDERPNGRRHTHVRMPAPSSHVPEGRKSEPVGPTTICPFYLLTKKRKAGDARYIPVIALASSRPPLFSKYLPLFSKYLLRLKYLRFFSSLRWEEPPEEDERMTRKGEKVTRNKERILNHNNVDQKRSGERRKKD